MRKSATIGLAASLLAVSLFSCPLPSRADTAPAPAAGKAGNVVDGSSVKAPSITLEKAIALAREKVEIPVELDKFSSDYSEYNGRGRWMLRWYSSSPPESNMHVTINAVTGEVENLSFYKGIQPGVRYQGLPEYSREQCLEIARREAARLTPDKYAATVFDPGPGEQWTELSGLRDRDYPVIYDFRFKRTVNGIPVADQGINVGINADTGQLSRFDCNWDTDIKLPSPGGKVSPEEARRIFEEKGGFELTYFMAVKEDPDAAGDIKLIYRQKPPGRFVLNAITGEIMDTDKVYIQLDELGGAGGSDLMYSKQIKAPVELTPAETRAVEENREFISADRAQEIASRLVDIPDDYTVAGRSLERFYGIPGGRLWNVQFADEDKDKWVRVSIDARTGELISFSREDRMDPRDYYTEPQVKFSLEEARKTAEQLIGKMQPERFGQVVFRQSEEEMGPWVKMGHNVPGAYYFTYARLINGIVYPENGFNVRVSSTTGEVTLYQMTWLDFAFPKAEGVIGEASANDRFLSAHPLTLGYGRGYQKWTTGEETPQYYLVYTPAGGSGVMLDALSGQEVDYRGKPVVKKEKNPFTDIAGHPAEQDILLLAREGIITGEGGKFRPDDQITAAECLAMLVKAYSQRGPYYPMEKKDAPWYQGVIDNARAMEILDEEFTVNPNDGLNRLQLARLGINAAGWGKLAGHGEIFKLEVADARSVPVEYRGYVASALAVGLIEPVNGQFSPARGVTRAEAATFLVKLLRQ